MNLSLVAYSLISVKVQYFPLTVSDVGVLLVVHRQSSLDKEAGGSAQEASLELRLEAVGEQRPAEEDGDAGKEEAAADDAGDADGRRQGRNGGRIRADSAADAAVTVRNVVEGREQVAKDGNLRHHPTQRL